MTPRADPLRVAFIGAGGIAERHVGLLGRMDDVVIVAVADPDFERAAGLAAQLRARPFRHHEDLLMRASPDAVFICVPPFAHGGPEEAALDAGLPFFVEKPLSLQLESAMTIATRIREQALVTAVGYQWRYLDTVEETRRLLADNPPQLVSGFWLDQTPQPQWWWRNDRSGGQIVEQATHIVDLARHLVGDICEVYARSSPPCARSDFPGLDVAAAHAATLWFANGAVGNVASTCMLRWDIVSGCTYSPTAWLAAETIGLLEDYGEAIRREAITHIVPVNDAVAFLDAPVRNRPDFLQIVFSFAP